MNWGICWLWENLYFKWFDEWDRKNYQFATYLKDSGYLIRICCGVCHELIMVAEGRGSGEKILTFGKNETLERA